MSEKNIIVGVHGLSEMSEETAQAIEKMVGCAIDQIKKEACEFCGGTGYDSYPNHSTSYPICPHCCDDQPHTNKEDANTSEVERQGGTSDSE